MLVKTPNGFIDTHETTPVEVDLTDDEIDEIIEAYIDTDSPYDIFKDSIHIHSWYENGDCCEAGTYAEVEDQPSASDFYEDLRDFAEEEYGEITYESYKRLCDAWTCRYENGLREKYEERARENYFEDDYDPY